MYQRIGLFVACFPMEDEILYGSPMEFTYQKNKNSYGIQLPNLTFYMVFKNKNKKSFQTWIWEFYGFQPMVSSHGFIMLETYGWKFWLPMAARIFFLFYAY